MDLETNPISLEYPKASLTKRAFAFLLDFLCAVFLTTGIAALGLLGLRQTPQYKNALEAMDSIEVESGLYVENESSVYAITDFYTVSSSSAGETDYQTIDDEFESALVSFYSSEVFFPDGNGSLIYESLKVGDSCLTYDLNDVATPYWKSVLDSEGKSSIVMNCDYGTLYDFYQSAISDDAIPAISSHSVDYINASKTVFWGTFAVVAGAAYLSLIIFFFLVPLFFRRGWQTFGMKLFKISLINAQAVSLSGKQYVCRSLLFFFFEFVLGAFAFAIPIFVSFTMCAIRKDGQSFHDYVAGAYMVDTSEEQIYKSRAEYEKINEKNRDLEIKDSEEVVEKEK
jgi:uncharacterized RDD family membrane protein YckC